MMGVPKGFFLRGRKLLWNDSAPKLFKSVEIKRYRNSRNWMLFKYINPKGSHITANLSKIKLKEIFKVAREIQLVAYEETSMKFSVHLGVSFADQKALNSKHWKKYCQQKILYEKKLSFKHEGEIKTPR